MTENFGSLYGMHLLFNRPVEFSDGIFIKVPTIGDLVENSDYSKYVSCFTTLTREIFAIERNVDALEEAYPTLWSVMVDPPADIEIGRYFSSNKKLSEVIIEGLAYWSGLETSGFKQLSNGKIYHKDPDWLIDEVEFNRMVEFIKFLTLWTEPQLAPKITSDYKFQAWKSLYNSRKAHQLKNGGGGLVNQIVVLSISMESYIPISEIEKMTLFHFNQMIKAIGLKTVYDEMSMLRASPNYKIEKLTHWSQQYKIN